MSRAIRAIWILAVLAAGTFPAGSGECGAALAPWALGDSYKLNPRTGQVYSLERLADVKARNSVWSAGDRTVRIAGARNEVAAFQVILEGGPRGLRDVKVTTGPLRGPGVIPEKAIALFWEFYTQVPTPSRWPGPSTGAGWYPDALIPFEVSRSGAPFAVSPGFSQAVWVDVAIPKRASAGEYAGTITVTAAGETPAALPLRLTVWDFALPDERHLRFWSDYSDLAQAFRLDVSQPRQRARREAIETSIWEVGHAHRLNALFQYDPIRPALRQTPRGPRLDWRGFDRRAGKYLDGSLFADRIPPNLFLLPVYLEPGQAKRWPPGDDATFVAVLQQLADHWRQKAWPVEGSFIYLGDEPKPGPAFAEIRHYADLARRAAPEFRRTVAFNRSPAEVLPLFRGELTLWLFDAGHYSARLLAPRQAAGDWVGFYQYGEPWVGNETLDADALSFRTWPWIAWKYRVDVLHLYAMTNWIPWRKGFDIWTDPRNYGASSSNGVLVYPGSRLGIDGVVPSIRLKMIRRGMQDYEYFWLARARGRSPDAIVSGIIRRALDEATRPEFTPGDWSRDPLEWERARADLAALIAGAPPAAPATPSRP